MSLIENRNHKILIVDDNPKNIQVAMNILKDFNVIYAQSGQRALELVEQNSFDLILLDIVMPNMDGYEVCEILKANEKTKDIPIIFLTVKDEEKDIVKGLDIGAVDYLTKPFYSQVLLKRVQLHLKLASTMRELTLVNENLNDLVQRQVEDLRKKDEILFKQSKMIALSEMIDMMTEQITYPLGLIKLQNQGLELKLLSDSIDAQAIQDSVTSINDELAYLDITLEDFKSFFKDDAQKDEVNLNVMIDGALLFFKDIFIKDNINVKVNGDVYTEVNFVRSELKHVLMKLIFNIVYLLKAKNVKDKKIEITFCDHGNCVKLDLKANIEDNNLEEINRFLEEELVSKEDTKELNIGLHLVKTLVEKNSSKILVEGDEQELIYNLEFSH